MTHTYASYGFRFRYIWSRQRLSIRSVSSTALLDRGRVSDGAAEFGGNYPASAPSGQPPHEVKTEALAYADTGNGMPQADDESRARIYQRLSCIPKMDHLKNRRAFESLIEVSHHKNLDKSTIVVTSIRYCSYASG